MKNTIIAPLGENIDALYLGIREFPTEKIILVATEENMQKAEKVRKDLEKFKIPIKIKKISGNIWEEIFKAIGEIKSSEQNAQLIVNVATGESNMRCAATCATFVNGIKAFDVTESNEIMILPVLRFSYYNMLTDKKLAILKILHNNQQQKASLDEINKKTGMSLPLISYHINGTQKSEGLKTLGLIETEETKSKLIIKLTMLGRLLIKGYIN